MVNSTEYITIDDVQTPADRVRLLVQECTTTGLFTTLYTCVAGAVVVPFFVKKTNKRLLIPTEYKMLFSAVGCIAFSYWAGVYAKRKCEEDLKRQLDEKLSF